MSTMLSIAGFVVKVQKDNIILSSHTDKYGCKDDREPDIVIDFDEKYLEDEIAAEREQKLDLPTEQSEYLAIYRSLCEKLIKHDCFLMHASVIAANGSAYAFTAPSGTGKSTHAALWRRNFPNTFMVNDDKPIIKISDGKVYACGTPWCGKHKLSSNVVLPLRGIGIITRSKELYVKRVAPKDEIAMMLNQIYRPKNSELMFLTIDLLNIMLKNVPLYRIGCDISDEAAILSYNTLTKEGNNNL